MDAKDLRTESALGTRNNDDTKYSQGSASLQAHRNKQYHGIGSNSLAKVDVPPARPCAVIGPDRVVPPPITDSYLKKAPLEPWLTTDNTYRRPPEYPHKLTDYQNPSRNISPRQTFQENMQRIMVPPSYNSAKLKEDHNFPVDANVQLRNNKLNAPPETKYCDVPYVNPMTNEQKNAGSEDISASNMNPVITRSVHGWPPGTANIRPSKPYGAHPELYHYPDYPSCAGPRPMMMTRPHRTVHEEPGPLYTDPYYHEGNIRYKPYPTMKERYPQARYEYIGNYSNPFHPPPSFPPHKYDPQKPLPPNLYPGYSQVPLKYLDPRMAEHVMNGYQRPSNQQPSFNNVPFRNQVIQSTYGAAPGNCLQNKFYPYPPEGPGKPIASNKIPYETNNKTYVEYENTRAKNYPMSESFYVNELARHQMKGPVLSPNYASVNMHPLPPHPYYRKENPLMKNYEYSPHFRNVDPSLNLSRLQSQYSLNTYAISPSDSSTSNDTTQTHGASQEDCGYVSQTSTASVRSMDSGLNRIPNDLYRRYDYRYGPVFRTSSLSKTDQNSNNAGSKGKKGIDVRQFLSMWNEGEDGEGGDSNNKVTTKAVSNNANDMAKQYETTSQEQLYVLGLVNVPSEELGKYEHIQKVSKLPENIKGYNSIELLNQFEEVIESSNLNNFSLKPPTPRDFHVSLKSSMSMQSLGLPPRPVSPLDVEAKISQSVIHKEVGCNFEIKPCSPKMLNVEIATPIQTVLDERVIEKVSNPRNIQSPALRNIDDNTSNMTNVIKPQDRRVTLKDNSKINSCKMINTQFSGNDSIDPVKANNYTLQDLESNSGICLASLPRLDNDCELNFPEVNQQFINANKVESVITQTPLKDLPPIDIDQCDTSTKDRDGQEKEIYQFSPSIELGKEFAKLSKYRKLKRKVPDNDNNSPLNHQVIRTDSVIIKNPENVKSQEDSARISFNNFAECVSLSPINLTTNTDTRLNESECNTEVNDHDRVKPFECAIDFSLNSNDHNGNKSKYNASNVKLKKENNSFNENLYVSEKLIDKLEKDPSEKSDSNCDKRKTCENNSNNSFILEDPKKVPTCDETVINFCADTVAVNNKLHSSTILENESDAMTKLLCEAASKSVQFESEITGRVDIEENAFNNSKDEFFANRSSAEDENRICVAFRLKTKTDPNIDHSVLMHKHIRRDPLGEDSTTKEFSRNVLPSENTVKDHLSSDKESEQIDRNVLAQQLSSSDNKYDFDDNMDVENKMESLFSDTIVTVNESAALKEDTAKASKTDFETDCLPDVQLGEQQNLLCIELLESKQSKCDESECIYIPRIKTRRYVNKELFSPWIQKLLYNEGLIDSSFDKKNNVITKTYCGTLSSNIENKRTSTESETFTCRLSEYISESQLSKTELGSDKLSVDELDNTICTETINNLKTDNYANEINDKLGCESNLDYSDSIKNALKESETKEELTSGTIGINTNINELTVTVTNKPFPKKITINDSVDEAILGDRNEILQQEITDHCDDTISNVKNKVFTEMFRTETNPPISDEVETDSLVNTVFESVSENINPLSVDESICKPIVCYNLDSNPHGNETIVDDVLCKNNVVVKLCLDETKILSADCVMVELDTESINTSSLEGSHCIDEKAIRKNSQLLLDDKEDEQDDEISANMNPLTAEESIYKPILSNLDSDPYRNETIVDNSPICKPKLDEITNEYCVDETKTFSIINSIVDELDKESMKTNSNADKNSSIEESNRKKLPHLLEDDKEDKPDDQNGEKKILEQDTNLTNDCSALESNSSDSRNSSCSSNIEDDGTQERPVVDLIFHNSRTNPEDEALASSTTESLNSCDLSEAEATYKSSDVSTEDVIETQNIASTNNLNDETQPEPFIDLALETRFSSSASTKGRLSCLSGIQENQQTCDSVIALEESVDAQDPIESNFLSDIKSTCERIVHEAVIEAFDECNLKEVQIDTYDTKLNDSLLCNSSGDLNFLKSRFSNKKRMLKRSYSESALDEYNLRETSRDEDPETNILTWPNKRKKNVKHESYIEQFNSENDCHIIPNSRRKSISTICEQNVSFCILIDDTCIITEDDEQETEKICFTEIPADCLPCIQNDVTSDGTTEKMAEIDCLQDEITSEFSNPFISDYVEEKTLDESWVEDVACVETVVSDDIAEDIVISASASPNDEDSSDYESNNDESGIFSLNEHTDKLKYIYGDKMCSDDAQLVETLYRTPQMDVNKTLVHKESQITDDCHRYYDEESLERVLSESNNCELKSYDSHSIAEFTSSLCPSGFLASDKTPDDKENVDMDNFDDNSLPFGIKNIDCDAAECENPEKKANFSQMFEKKTQYDTVHSCESSIDNVFSYNQPEVSPKYVISSSSEVSSTTSEDKNSSLFLKIIKYRETSTSQVNDFSTGRSVSCKYTEKKDCLYSNSTLPSRPLITKAAQKYIPPLKETIRDLKVKLPLPQNSLQKLKQLKLSKEEPKHNLKINKHDVVNVCRKEIPKKSKPKFEDVLKSIDEIQFKKHKEKSKKQKNIIPKVVIKKSENGSHYASTSNKDKFNPDLTGRKWQPWVFLEKNNFIDKMALKRKTKAVYSHRKNTYVLAERFQKYKSISSAKFIISQPKFNEMSPGQLKYTIRLKHTY